MKRSLTGMTGLVVMACLAAAGVFSRPAFADDAGPLIVVVMDPLAAPLSCPCVKGYAQRDYKKLAEHLQRELERPVKIYFHESLTSVLEEKTSGRADLVIGKRSVVAAEAAEAKLPLKPILALTGKDGNTV